MEHSRRSYGRLSVRRTRMSETRDASPKPLPWAPRPSAYYLLTMFKCKCTQNIHYIHCFQHKLKPLLIQFQAIKRVPRSSQDIIFFSNLRFFFTEISEKSPCWVTGTSESPSWVFGKSGNILVKFQPWNKVCPLWFKQVGKSPFWVWNKSEDKWRVNLSRFGQTGVSSSTFSQDTRERPCQVAGTAKTLSVEFQPSWRECLSRFLGRLSLLIYRLERLPASQIVSLWNFKKRLELLVEF